MTDQPTVTRQFVACRFRPSDVRDYTFHNDGQPVAVGDFVEVEARGSVKIVEVIALPTETPSFPTKPIIGKAPPPEAQEASAAA